MDNMKRIFVGVVFAAMLTLTLVASGGQAYAGGGMLTQDIPQPLGITWE